MRTYNVICFQSGNGWMVNASSGKRAMVGYAVFIVG